MRIRLKSYVYQFDIELNDYVKTNQTSKKWINPVFNENMRYAVDDIGIHTYKSTKKRY